MFYIGFVIYIVALVLIGYLTSRRTSKGEGFVNGGGAIKIIPLIGTIGATMIGSGLSMGATANGYRYGWGGAVFALGSATGLFLLSLMYTSVRKYGFSTVAQEAQFYYGGNKNIRVFMSVFAVLAEIIWVATAIKGGSQYLSYITGLNDVATTTITTIAFFSFTVFGGYLSVVWTDTIQFIIIIVGFFIITLNAIPAAGGMESIRQAFDAAGNSGAMSFYGLKSYGIMPALTLIVTAITSPLSVQSFRTRVYTASSAKTARKSFISAAIMVFFFSLMPSIIGMSAFAICFHNGTLLSRPDYAFVFMAVEIMPPMMGLFFLIAGVSATLSSADSNAMAAVTIILDDLIPMVRKKKIESKKYSLAGRIMLVVITLLAFALSLYTNDLITFISSVAGAFVPSLAAVLFMGKYWKRATWQGGIGCLLSGAVIGVSFLTIPAVNQTLTSVFGGVAIPSLIISVACCLVVSLFTKKDTHTPEEALKLVKAGQMGQ